MGEGVKIAQNSVHGVCTQQLFINFTWAMSKILYHFIKLIYDYFAKILNLVCITHVKNSENLSYSKQSCNYLAHGHFIIVPKKKTQNREEPLFSAHKLARILTP